MAPEKHRPPSPLDKILPQKHKEGTATCWCGPFFVIGSRIRRLALAAKGLNLLEEVVALVIYEDEGGEVFYLNLPGAPRNITPARARLLQMAAFLEKDGVAKC